MAGGNTYTNAESRSMGTFIYTCIRMVGVGFMVLAVLTGKAALCWLSVPFMAVTLWVSLVVQIAYRQNLPRLPHLEVPPEWPEGKEWPLVTLLASARNEEQGIEASVRSLMASDYPSLQVVIVDDHSTDATPAILDRLAAEFSDLHVVHDPPYQEGWGGKGNAIWHTVNHVLDERCKWVITTDADVRFEPAAVRAAVAHAEALGVDYFTCMPRFEPKLLCEELTLITSSWAMAIAGASYKPKGIPRAVGLGPFAMFTREIYLRSGGHAPFKARSPEDANLARSIREAGGRAAIGLAGGLVHFRHYVGYEEVRRASVTKARVYQFDSIPAILGMLTHALASLCLPLPLALMAARFPVSAPIAVFAAMQLASYLSETARFTSQRTFIDMRAFVPWAHPLGGLMRVWFCSIAIGQIAANKRLDWRGRNYADQNTTSLPPDQRTAR